MDRKSRLSELLSDHSELLSDEKLDKLLMYYDMLIEKNKVMNLTAITEFDDVAVKHFADSLSLIKVLDPSGKRIIDIGTGAGFPGIPLKICFPDTEIVLLDSLNKRVNFLNEVISQLGLTHITAVHERAEEAAHKDIFREKFDLAVSRAVANLSTLVEYCLPFVAPGGSFVSYKSSKASEELSAAGRAIRILGGDEHVDVTSFMLLGDDMERNLLEIRKSKPTPGQYPRMGGKPSKEPLC